jgi:DNA-binding helix-hairpin-helix protein with protein kinase domain
VERALTTEFERYDRDFHKKQGELLAAADRLQHWAKEEVRIRAETDARKRELQLRAFLDRQLISQATIPNIGDKRKAKLAAYGVETALDVTKSIVAMPGFGEGLFEALRRWRASRERVFRFDPRQPLPHEVIRDMENRIIQTKRNLESEIRSGPEQLKRFNAAMGMKINQYHSQLPTLVRNKVQAEADLRPMG